MIVPLFAQAQPVTKELAVRIQGNMLEINAGAISLDGTTFTQPSRPAAFKVAPAEHVWVADEPWTLPNKLPDRWGPGAHLKGCVTFNTLPGCLDPSSVVVKLSDGTILDQGKDYILEPRWAGIARVEGGRLTTDTKVLVSYRYGLMRLDSVQLSPKGNVTLVHGTPERATPAAPAVMPGCKHVANIFMPYHTTSVSQEQIFSVGAPFPEPDAAEMQKRAAGIPKTLEKLCRGDPITVVTWGDSVTYGCDPSTPAKAYANLFITRLRERFPKATIKHVNAGIGATNTDHRLPHIKEQVLDYKPDLVTIEFVNDMGFDEEHLRSNYRSAVDQILAAGAELILITPHFTFTESMQKSFPRGEETRPAITILRKIAEELHVPLSDTSRRWEHLDSEGIPYLTLLANGINHPDDRGHELFVKDLMTFFPAE